MTDGDDLAARVAALEDTVAKLEAQLAGATNRDLPLLKGTVRVMLDGDVGELTDLPDAGRAFQQRLAGLDDRLDAVEQQVAALGDLGTAKTTKEEKLAAILAFAANKRGTRSGTVAVTASEIQGCVGVSRRYAYELIEAAAEACAGTRVREATDVQTSSGVRHKKKALLVDCEAVHTDDAAVNQFTTGRGGELPLPDVESRSEAD